MRPCEKSHKENSPEKESCLRLAPQSRPISRVATTSPSVKRRARTTISPLLPCLIGLRTRVCTAWNARSIIYKGHLYKGQLVKLTELT